jgi:3-hydroxy-9,10-secoandrosta-1,3,5(10)-triene-9,17-dione monooxygenase reductase component
VQLLNATQTASATLSCVAPVLGRLPSGLLVLTVRNGRHETGMLVSWVMQASFVPPSITVAIHNERYVGHWLTAGCPFVLNLLEHGHARLLRHFARGFPPEGRPFAALDLDRTEKGIAILRDALGYLECEPQNHIDSGDHRVFLAKVTGGNLRGLRAPMVHIRRSGMRY